MLKKLRKNRYINWIIVFISPFITTLLIVILRLYLSPYLYPGPFLLFSLVVLLQSFLGGKSSGILASFLTAIAGNYFFMQPNGYLKFDDNSYIFQTLLYLFQSLIIAWAIGKFMETEKKYLIVNEQLKSSSEVFRDILDNAFTLIAVTNANGVITEADSTFAKIVNNDWSKIIGKKLFDTIPWDYDGGVSARMYNALSNQFLND